MDFKDDNFSFVMPAEIIKGDDGDWKIGGLASTEDVDRQGESIIQKGVDLTPVEEGKGFFNFDHSNKPEDLIGTVDGYKRDGKGLYVHGTLFKGHKRAEAVYSIMKAMGERKKGAIGLSVEGKVIERDPSNPKIIKKCQIRNVAVTFNPVNQKTYASLMKSMSAADVEFEATKENALNPESLDKAVTFTPEQVSSILKALGVGAGQMQAPCDRSGGDAMVQSDLKPGEEPLIKEEEPKKKKKLKKLSKALYKSNLEEVLDRLQTLYPDYSRTLLWASVKDRLETRYED